MAGRRFLVIACAILQRECYACAARSDNLVTLRLCEKGLHDIGAKKMTARLQAELDAVDPKAFDAILLGYGLCSNGTEGLRSSLPLVLPRAHDCITLLMGSKERYMDYFNRNAGTYYQSPGWIEQGDSCLTNPDSTVSQMGMATYQGYVQKYGEENAKYLMESLGMTGHYSKLAYIDTGVGDAARYREFSKKEAAEKSFEYEEIPGDLGLLQRMMDGTWDEREFLVIPPGETMRPSHDDKIVKSMP